MYIAVPQLLHSVAVNSKLNPGIITELSGVVSSSMWKERGLKYIQMEKR